VSLPDAIRHLPPPIGWDYLALPPGGPLTISALESGIGHLTRAVVPWWIVFTTTLANEQPTQDIVIQITQPGGIRYQVTAAQSVAPGQTNIIVAGAAVPQLENLQSTYTQIALPLRPWTPPIGVRILYTNGALVTNGTVPFSTWLVSPCS